MINTMSTSDSINNDENDSAITESIHDSKTESFTVASNNENRTNIDNFPKKEYIKQLITIFATIIIIGILAFIGIYLYKNNNFNKTKLLETQQNDNTDSPEYRLLNNLPLKEKFWILKKINGETSNSVIIFLGNHLEQWKDWIFYTDNIDGSIQIQGYNFQTEEIQTIYDLRKDTYFSERGHQPYTTSDMQIIDNTLYFSLGGYMAYGATFWISLPPTGQPQMLADGANSRIVYLKNNYLLVSGEGDGCWSMSDYSLLDLPSKMATEIASSKSGCVEGEEYIDIDKLERMIMAFHTAGTEEGENGKGKYKYVVAIPLTNPSSIEEIITEENMPNNIGKIIYLENTNQLLLIGTENYLYDFSSKQITKTDMLIPSPTPGSKIQEKPLEDKVKELNLPEGYQFVEEYLD